ncbi:NUDIX domain-containing protein [Kineococcus sp. NPDC059986]|uniref:NUDIX domain-containing protein n=1 Tax=Kineococcus sp. NPDC059986 TaxID=3155538 RepID=UPI00344EC18D
MCAGPGAWSRSAIDTAWQHSAVDCPGVAAQTSASDCLAPLVHTVAVGILIHDDRVLLALRSAKRRAHPVWAPPGGHVEPGEPEELDIDILDCDEEHISRLHLTASSPGAGLPRRPRRRTFRAQLLLTEVVVAQCVHLDRTVPER